MHVHKDSDPDNTVRFKKVKTKIGITLHTVLYTFQWKSNL